MGTDSLSWWRCLIEQLARGTRKLLGSFKGNCPTLKSISVEAPLIGQLMKTSCDLCQDISPSRDIEGVIEA